MKVYEPDLKKLLPQFMQKDCFDTSLIDEISAMLGVDAYELDTLSTWKYIDEMNDADINRLANDIYIPWLNPAETLEVKRELVKHAVYVWRHIGTPDALRMVLDDIYKTADLVEWFDSPEYLDRNEFSVYVANTGEMTASNKQRLIKTINLIKRASQKIVEIYSQDTVESEYTAVATHLMQPDRVLMPEIVPLCAPIEYEFVYYVDLGICELYCDTSIVIAE